MQKIQTVFSWVIQAPVIGLTSTKLCSNIPELFVLVHREKRDGSIVQHLSFSCLSQRIGLFLKWAISKRVWLLFKEMTTAYKIFSCRIIFNRFYFSGHHFISMMQCWIKAPRGQSVHTREHVAGTCTHNILICVQMLWFCPCCMSPLHVPATCPLSVHYTPFRQCNMSLQHSPAIWPIVSGHLNCSLFQPIGALFDRELFTNSATGFPPTETNITLFPKSGQWAHLASSVLVVSWKSYKVPSIVLYLANFKPVFIS